MVDAEVIEAISEAESMLQKEGAVIEKRPLEFLRFVIPTYYILALQKPVPTWDVLTASVTESAVRKRPT